jgi:hypothetical protein
LFGISGAVALRNFDAKFKKAGVDIRDVSADQISINARTVYGRMFQTQFSDRLPLLH